MFKAEYDSSGNYWKTNKDYDEKTNQFIDKFNQNTREYYQTLTNTTEEIRRLLTDD